MKSLYTISAAVAALATTAGAHAQTWSHDGQTQYSSYQSCERARTTRTIGGAAIGGVVGAGLGALAGGDDTRNTVVGGAVGAIAGGMTGQRSVKCTQTHAPVYTAQPSRYPANQSYYPAPAAPAPVTRTVYTTSSQTHAPVQTSYPTRTYTVRSAPVTTTRRVYSYTEPARVYRPATPTRVTHTSYPSPTPVYRTVHTPAPAPVYQPAPQPVYQPAPQPVYQPAPAPTVWTSGDGAYHGSQQSCQAARRNRTVASGGLGALAGAGLGTLAGGNDRRNAAVGAVAGAVIGASSGYNSVKCYAVQRPASTYQSSTYPAYYH